MEPPDPTDPRPAQARATIRGVLRIQMLANGLGVTSVWAYFQFLLPGNEEGRLESATINLVAFGIYVGLMVLLALPFIHWIRRREIANRPAVR